MASGRVILYGGRGALGAACLDRFKSSNWWVANVDLTRIEQADLNITVPREASWVQQEEYVLKNLASELKDQKVNAVICVTGSWIGGNSGIDLSMKPHEMWRQSVWSSTIAATVASKHLANGGLLVFTSSKSALDNSPAMIDYGMAKAAMLHLTKSLGTRNSGMPANSSAVAIMPEALDTEINRKLMPNSDFSTLTPLPYVAELLEDWVKGQNRPISGSLVSLITKDNKTKMIKE